MCASGHPLSRFRACDALAFTYRRSPLMSVIAARFEADLVRLFTLQKHLDNTKPDYLLVVFDKVLKLGLHAAERHLFKCG